MGSQVKCSLKHRVFGIMVALDTHVSVILLFEALWPRIRRPVRHLL